MVIETWNLFAKIKYNTNMKSNGWLQTNNLDHTNGILKIIIVHKIRWKVDLTLESFIINSSNHKYIKFTKLDKYLFKITWL